MPLLKNCHATGGSVFSGKIYCGECGQIYGTKVWHSNDPYRKVVWHCNDKFKKDGEKQKCSTPTLTEDGIRAAFERVLLKLGSGKKEIIENLRVVLEDGSDSSEDELEKERLERVRYAVANLYEQEIKKNARVAQDQEEYRKREDDLRKECGRLDAEISRLEREISEKERKERRIADFIAALEAAGDEFTVDDWCIMVEKVTVLKEKMVFTLTSGEEVEA